jgi:hypothetical protein
MIGTFVKGKALCVSRENVKYYVVFWSDIGRIMVGYWLGVGSDNGRALLDLRWLNIVGYWLDIG